MSNRIKYIREYHGMSQKELASHIGIAESSLQNYEYGKRNIPSDVVVKLCKFFDCTSDYLLDINNVDGNPPELYELEAIREKSGMSAGDVADEIGVPIDVYESWEECADAPKSESVIKELADLLHVSVEALYGYDLVDPGTLTHAEDYDKNDFIRRPVYLEVAAGQPIWMQETSMELPAPSEILRSHPRSVFVRVDGDSMDNVLPDGCYALVDTDSTEVPDGTACCVTVNGYSATIKRVHHISNGYMLAPDSSNPEHKPIIYNYDEDGTDEVRILGEVVWYMVPFDWEI